MQVTAWFVVLDPKTTDPDDDRLIFAVPFEKWDTLEYNCSHNQFEAVCFGTEEEAREFAHAHSTSQRVFTPWDITFHFDMVH